MDDIYQQVGFGTSEGDSLRAPEGQSFFVVGTSDPAVAKQVAPLLARKLEPGQRFGRVLHVEQVTEQVTGFEVVLEVLNDEIQISKSQNNR